MEVKTMNSFECSECETEFIAERASTCPKCGSPNVISELSPEISPAASPDAEICEIIERLCVDAYNSSYRSYQWTEAIDRTMKQLKPFLREGAAT